MSSSIAAHALLAASLFALTGCLAGPESDTDAAEADEAVASTFQSFEAYEATVYREPGSGVYIVDGDTPIVGRDALRTFYETYVLDGALIVNTIAEEEDIWSASEKRELTYCVSGKFGEDYQTVVDAMDEAARSWESAANVDFRHVPAEDWRCNARNTAVLFDVNPVSGAPYLARSFFPSQDRATRNVMVDATLLDLPRTSVLSVAGVLRHELGHTLGFRHEHTRPEAQAAGCFEDDNWVAVTAYDSMSVMHYPHCNGAQRGDLALSPLDKQGVAAVYGSSRFGLRKRVAPRTR